MHDGKYRETGWLKLFTSSASSACLKFGPKVQQNVGVLGRRPLYCDDALLGTRLWQGSLCGSLKMQPWKRGLPICEGLGGVTNVATPTAPPTGCFLPVFTSLSVTHWLCEERGREEKMVGWEVPQIELHRRWQWLSPFTFQPPTRSSSSVIALHSAGPWLKKDVQGKTQQTQGGLLKILKPSSKKWHFF